MCRIFSHYSLGRTARAGLKGKAFSFYTERDEPLAELLTKTLLETKQEIPEFLQQYVPENVNIEELKFEPDSDEEIEDAAGAGGWGADAGGWPESADAGDAGDAGDGWGASNDAANDNSGWGADNNNGGGAAPAPAADDW